MPRSFIIIVNPVAGRGRARRRAARLEKALTERGADARIEFTTAPGHAAEIAARLAHDPGLKTSHAPIPLALGGDGTLREVARAVAGSGGLMAAVAGGRCNDFLRAIDLPRDVEGAADALVSGAPRKLDVGRINGELFLTVAALGFDAAVSRYVNDARLPLYGQAAYLWGTVRTLMTYRPIEVKLSGDFGAWEGPVFLAAFANTRCYGGGIQIAPDARPDDGLLELCVIRPASRRRVLRMLPWVMKGRHANLPEVSFLRSREVRIETAVPTELWADGEYVCRTPVTIRADPGALRVLSP